MPARKTEQCLRQVGHVRGDYWERFDRLQRNLQAFLRGKPKRAPIERFRSYADLEHGRSDPPSTT
jgi:hypothetical protein